MKAVECTQPITHCFNPHGGLSELQREEDAMSDASTRVGASRAALDGGLPAALEYEIQQLQYALHRYHEGYGHAVMQHNPRYNPRQSAEATAAEYDRKVKQYRQLTGAPKGLYYKVEKHWQFNGEHGSPLRFVWEEVTPRLFVEIFSHEYFNSAAEAQADAEAHGCTPCPPRVEKK